MNILQRQRISTILLCSIIVVFSLLHISDYDYNYLLSIKTDELKSKSANIDNLKDIKDIIEESDEDTYFTKSEAKNISIDSKGSTENIQLKERGKEMESYLSLYHKDLQKHPKMFSSKECITWEKVFIPSHNYRLPENSSKADEQIIPSGEDNVKRKLSFQMIFDTNAWGRETKSGPGSQISSTHNIRNILNSVVEKIKTVLERDEIKFLDSSCGDMTWMKIFLQNRTDIKFTGWDIVQSNVDNHRETFSDQGWQFETHDLVTDQIETRFDLILSRHTTQHLQSEDVIRVIKNFQSSGSRFLLMTSYPHASLNQQLSLETKYRHRPLNFYLSPFNLPPPICDSKDVKDDHMMLWDLSSLNLSH